VLVSLAAHVLAAVTASVVLPLALRDEGHEVEIEVNLAHTDLTGPAEEPKLAPPTTPASRTPTTSHKSGRARTPAPPERKSERPSADAPVEDSPASTPAEQGPPLRFKLAGGTVAMRVSSSSPITGEHVAATEAGKGSAGSDEVLSEKDVSIPARLIADGPVAYPPEARRAEVEADVPVQILVDTAGRVLEARSLIHRGYGLDEAAAQAIRTWRFSPALRDGHPTRVRMRWIVQFRLR